MRKFMSMTLLVAVVLVLAGCVQPIQQGSTSGTVTGTVTYTARMALPDDAVVIVQLRDADSGGNHGALVNEQQINTNGNQVPIAFEVPYTKAAINQSHTYVLFAVIQDGAGNILFTSEEGVPVLTNGNPVQGIEVLVVPANGEQAAPADSGQAAAAPTGGLPGTSWSAILFNDGSSAIVSVQGVQITAEFSVDGQLSGFSGCNNYSATYTTGDDGSIQISPIASTMKACTEPANVMEQESQYLAALQSAAAYQLQDEMLELENADGQSVVQYEQAGP